MCGKNGISCFLYYSATDDKEKNSNKKIDDYKYAVLSSFSLSHSLTHTTHKILSLTI